MIYRRQSLDANGDGLAVQRQLNACRTLIRQRSWQEVADPYTDNSVSASGKRPRPEFNRMLADAKAGMFDVVVASDLDRLTRTVEDFLVLRDLAEKHGVAVTTVDGDLDLTTDSGQAVAGVLAVFANLEIKRKGKRQTKAGIQRADAGRPSQGGPRPFGYEADKVTIRKSEATALRAAYRSLLSGRSASAIARDLNAAGYITAQKNPWTHSSVRNLLTNPRNAGYRIYKGEVHAKATWRGIVDESTWRSACALFADPARRTNHSSGSVSGCSPASPDAVSATTVRRWWPPIGRTARGSTSAARAST